MAFHDPYNEQNNGHKEEFVFDESQYVFGDEDLPEERNYASGSTPNYLGSKEFDTSHHNAHGDLDQGQHFDEENVIFTAMQRLKLLWTYVWEFIDDGKDDFILVAQQILWWLCAILFAFVLVGGIPVLIYHFVFCMDTYEEPLWKDYGAKGEEIRAVGEAGLQELGDDDDAALPVIDAHQRYQTQLVARKKRLIQEWNDRVVRDRNDNVLCHLNEWTSNEVTDLNFIAEMAESQLKQETQEMMMYPEVNGLRKHFDKLRYAIDDLERRYGATRKDAAPEGFLERLRRLVNNGEENIYSAHSHKHSWFDQTYDIGRRCAAVALAVVLILEVPGQFDFKSIILPASCSSAPDYSLTTNPREWGLALFHSFDLFSWIRRTAKSYSEQLFRNISCIIDCTVYVAVLIIYALVSRILPPRMNALALLFIGLLGLPMELVETATLRVFIVGVVVEVVNFCCHVWLWNRFPIDTSCIGSKNPTVTEKVFAAQHRFRRLAWYGILIAVTVALGVFFSDHQVADHPLPEWLTGLPTYLWQMYELHYT